MDARIKLLTESKDCVSLVFFAEEQRYRVEDIINNTKRVYEDLEYTAKIEAESDFDAEVYLDEERIGEIITGRDDIIFQNKKSEYLFKNQLGYVRFVLKIRNENGSEQFLFSEYASVLIRDNNKNNEIDSMLKYIYSKQSELLQKPQNSIKTGKNFESSRSDFLSTVILLEETVKTYETCYGYFKANSRYELKPTEVVDRVEKMQFVDGKTISYIVQHPDLLKKETIGIRYGAQTYLPQKTMMVQNKISYNIYENQIVVSFIEYLTNEVRNLKKKISDLIECYDKANYSEKYYINSSYLIHLNALNILKEYENRVDNIIGRIREIALSYRNMLDVSPVDCTSCPRPTAVFLSVPQYSLIYTCIYKWYNKSGYDFNEERVILGFINVTQVYEAYVLAKLVEYVQTQGYQLTRAVSINYPHRGNWKHRNKEYNNMFCFELGEKKLTIYYEPVIYDRPNVDLAGIGLYRNNSVPFMQGESDNIGSTYYTPDYLIKLQCAGVEEYLICDAKYSYRNKVKKELFPQLAYKYLFSISPVSEYVFVRGLIALYGLTNETSVKESFYDNQGCNRIIPAAELVPMAEQIPISNQRQSLSELFCLFEQKKV